MKKIVLDIGGTAMKSAVFENGMLTDIRETPTPARLGGARVVEQAKEIVREYQNQYSCEGIGISTAGQVDPIRGSIIYANQNIPGYTGMQLKKIMEETFGLPTAVQNDVNAAALGEAHFGAGRGEKDFACLTYGTGVGGALFIRGALYGGNSFSAGEFGGILTHPEKRNPKEDIFSGCYERYASATALVKRAVELDPSLTNGRIIFDNFSRPEVKQVIDAWIMEIVYGLITITHMLNPSCIILGGGILEQPYILTQVRQILPEHIMSSFQNVTLKKAELGNQAGMLGAATL